MKRLLLSAIVLGAAAFMAADRTTSIEAAPVRTPSIADAPSPPVDDLTVTRRRRGDLEVEDLFSSPAPPPAAAPPAPVAPPKPEPAAAPTAPPLPFTYLGRMTRRGNPVVYLQRNQEMVVAQAGETLDGTYLVESITPSAVQFVYLPLQSRQHLAIPHAP